MSETFLRIDAVRERTGLGRSTIYRLIAEKKFPAPISNLLGLRATAWLESEIDAWQRARIAERDSMLEVA